MESSKSVWDRAYKKAMPHMRLCGDTHWGRDRECLQQGKNIPAPYDCAEPELYPLCSALRKMTALRKARKEAAGESLWEIEK